jgi:RHS repeat-associated protein
MRTWLSGVVISAALAGACLFSMAGSAFAQSNDAEYCYGTICGTQEDAVTALGNAYPDYRGLFKNTGQTVAIVAGQLHVTSLTYTVPDKAPASFNPPVYAFDPVSNPAPQFCAPSGDPTYPNGCASESEMVANLMASEKAIYGATTAAPAYFGSYVEPFSETHTVGMIGGIPFGWLRHNWDINYALIKRVEVTYNAPGWTSPRVNNYVLRKFTSFPCPVGFTPKQGTNPSYNPNASSLLTAPVCTPSINAKSITTRLRQSSCPTNAEGLNPCYPSTGDKARFETDFEFAGRPFARSYHSLRQAGQLPELAPGWVHAYSDRISGNPSVLSEPLLWTSDSGYLEVFTRVGSGNRFVSNGNANKILDVEPTNTLAYKYTLTDSGTQVRYFNAAGRLIRIEDRNSAWKIELAYQGDRLMSATDHTGKQLTFDYSNDQLVAIHLPDGNAVVYGYDVNSNLQSVQYADGTTKIYHYNEAGYSDASDPHALTGITDNGQRYATYAYDSKGRVRLSQFHTVSGPVEKTELAYTGDTQVAVTGRNGETRNYTLSSTSGYRRVMSVASADGTTSNTYLGALTSESRDKNQNVTRYEYAADKAYLSARYDAFGTPEERKTVFVRDPVSYRITSAETQAKSGTAYVPIQRQTYTYNSRGQVLTQTMTDPSVTPNATRTTAYTYCEQTDVDAGTCPLVGLIKTMDGARTDLTGVTDITTYAYRQADEASCATAPTTCPYRKGDLWKVTNALGYASETLKYDGAGRVLSVKDPNSVVTDFEYDARGRMTARKVRGTNDTAETDDQITRIDYWPTGLVKKVTQPDGAFTSYTYDDAHRLIGIADNAGNSMTYTLNAASERTKEDTKDASGVLQRTLSRTYNTLGQLQTVTDAYGRNTGFTYDANSNLDTSTDALTRAADNNYDPLNRLSRTLQDMNGIAAETKFGYDALDNLTQVTDPKLLNTSYTYNGFSDLTQLVSPDTGTTLYTYDSAGNRKTQKDARSKTTTYSYDALNRLTSVTYATTALNTTTTYDTAQTACLAGETFTVGRVTKITDGSGSTVYCYDRFGNLVRKEQTTNANTLKLRYTYNVAGQLTSVIYPDGAVADYLYDTQGRVKEVGAKTATGTRQILLTGVGYYPFGPAAQWTYGTSTSSRLMKRSLNLNYQPGFVEVTAAGGISVGYEFDEVGNLKKLRAANQADPPKRLFGYDALNHLTETKDGSTNAVLQGYAYDKTGNRTSATVSGATTAYAYLTGNHRLNTVGTAAARVYDTNGNTTSIPGTVVKNFVYGDHNRMTQYKEGTTLKMSYVYNGRGEQVRKYASGTTNVYSLYDETGHWLGDYNNAAAVTQQVIWFGDLPVGVLVGAGAAQKLHYIEPDALGTPRVVVDPTRGTNGTAVWTWDLAGEAFGTTAPNQNPDGDAAQFVFNMRFPGQRYDQASGLYYNYFRDYDPSTGRYSQSDPIGLLGGASTYGYAGGDPMGQVDPRGLIYGETTYTAWCRQNPGACAALFGAGAIIVAPKPTTIPLPKISTGEKCKTCADLYPEYDECSEMSRYYPYASAAHALLDFPSGSKPRPGVPATGGACAMKGTHSTVFLNGSYVGSIFSCRCCTNTGGGPVINEIWGNNSGR